MYDNSTLVYELTCTLCMCYAMYKAVLFQKWALNIQNNSGRLCIYSSLSLHNIWTKHIKRRKLSLIFPKQFTGISKDCMPGEICLKVRHRDNMNNITQKPHQFHRILFIHTVQQFKHELK